MASRGYALSGANLISFDLATPTGIESFVPIVGLNAGEALVGIDFRPLNGLLYGLGVNAATDTGTLYVISTRTGFASVVGSFGMVGALPAGGYGFDFNPTVDLIRVTTDDGRNFRLNPNTGTIAVTDIAIVGNAISGVSYTNNQPEAGVITTLYTLDSLGDLLMIQNPPNAGIQIPVGLTGVDFSNANGFDIPTGVNAPAPGAPVTSGSGYALLTVGGTAGLYSVNLVTGAATLVGNLPVPASGFAIQNDFGGIPAIALSADGADLVRFNTATPGTTTSLAISGVDAGETLVGIDFRPSTGQLFGFGVDAATDTGTLYRIDPATGAVFAIGAAGGIAFVAADGSAVDLPAGGYGIDFNPTVDRIRITTDSGLNFRINPVTGAPVDGDLGGAPGSFLGVNTDGAINGLPAGSTGVSGAAYTNSFAPPGGVTTLYTLDGASNSLFIQNPAGSGTQVSQLLVTLGGSALDFTSVNGFDIPPGVNAGVSGGPATGFGFADLTVGGVGSLYKIDLATGAAIDLGVIGTGAIAFAGLALADSLAVPVIVSNGGGATADVAVLEGTTAVTTVVAVDNIGTPFLYSIAGGADAARFQINASTGALAFLAAPDFEAPTDADHNNSYVVQVRALDLSIADLQTITVTVTDLSERIGTPGEDFFTALGGPERIDALGGIDTITFNFRLVDATVSYVGNTVVIDGPSTHAVLTGFETYVFTDGTVNNNDGNWLVDDLFYYSTYHDVWNAHASADQHFASNGWREGRNPDAFFSTSVYLSANPDVATAGVNPLDHWHSIGWTEGRVPSISFDPAQYLAANADVAAAHVDPLSHFLQFGAGEGRLPFAATSLVTANGFDYVFYLNHDPDVAAAGVDPFQHFMTIGWTEGRDPNALFDTEGYLANYSDVDAANVNPLAHYHTFGSHEGRDPSVDFDTTSYLAAYPDVQGANVNPLVHFLQFGMDEGRSAFADGVWG